MIDDAELERRLGRSDDAEPHARVQAALGVLLSEVPTMPRNTSTRKRRAGLLSLIGVVSLSGIVAAPAAADMIARFVAQTGAQCVGTECGSAGDEFIDSTAADLPEYVASVYPTWLPLTSSMTRDSVTQQVVSTLQAAPGDHQALAVQKEFEKQAYCAWIDVWLSANAAGDLALQGQATAVMEDEPTWPARVATDGGGIVEDQKAYAAAAVAGDAVAVQNARSVNGCGLVPTFAQ